MLNKISKISVFLVLFVFCFSCVCFAETKLIHTYPMCDLNEHVSEDVNSETINTYKAGDCILTEDLNDGWLKTENGYVESRYCMVNLADAIPYMEFDITNSYGNIYTSSGQDLIGTTGEKMYYFAENSEKDFENKSEAYAIAKYSFMQKLRVAEEIAEKKGYVIKVYDAYRPRSVTIRLREALSLLMLMDEEVKNNVILDKNNVTWGIDFFLAQEVSSHNYGCAVDATLMSIDTEEEVQMPCKMHELSTQAIKTTSPVSEEIIDFTADDGNNYVQIMNDIFSEAGLTGLASEYWHYQDNESLNDAKSFLYNGCDFN